MPVKLKPIVWQEDQYETVAVIDNVRVGSYHWRVQSKNAPDRYNYNVSTFTGRKAMVTEPDVARVWIEKALTTLINQLTDLTEDAKS
jgi:hypothetical protein